MLRIPRLALTGAAAVAALVACAPADPVKGNSGSLMAILDPTRPDAVRAADVTTLDRLASLFAGQFRKSRYQVRFQKISFPEKTYQKTFSNSKYKILGLRLQKYYLSNPQKTLRRLFKHPGLDRELRRIILSYGRNSGEEVRVLVFFSNMDFKRNGVDSKGGYLADGWLTSKQSPFVKNVIEIHGSKLSGAKVMIFSDGSDSPFVRRGKEQFLSRLFAKIGADLYYYGPLYTKGHAVSAIGVRLFQRMIEDRMPQLLTSPPREADILQIERREGTVTVPTVPR